MDGSFGSRSSSSYGWEILFDGYRYDPDTGFYQVRYRYLHPNLGRWLKRDPIGEMGGMNLYAYVRSNPLTRLDPRGLALVGYPGEVEMPGRPMPSDKDDCCGESDPAAEFVQGQLKEGFKKVFEGDERSKDFIKYASRILVAADALKRICAAFNPELCEKFLKPSGSGLTMDACQDCCLEILKLFGSETAIMASNCATICVEFP